MLPTAVQNILIDARSKISCNAIKELVFNLMEALKKAYAEDKVECIGRHQECTVLSKTVTERALFLLDNLGQIFNYKEISASVSLPMTFYKPSYTLDSKQYGRIYRDILASPNGMAWRI